MPLYSIENAVPVFLLVSLGRGLMSKCIGAFTKLSTLAGTRHKSPKIGFIRELTYRGGDPKLA